MKWLSMQQLLSKHRLPVTILLAVLILLCLTPWPVYATDPTVTEVTCQPNPVSQAAATICTALVTSHGLCVSGVCVIPTGKVTWTISCSGINCNVQPGSKGKFSSTSCTLKGSSGAASAQCSVTWFTDTAAPIYPTITGHYAGSNLCYGSDGTFKVTVIPIP